MTEKSWADNLAENYKYIKERFDEAVLKSGRKEGEVTLLAATKTVPPEIINAAIGLGVTHIGENRVQEFLSKEEQVRGDVHRHFIGHLQTNKVKYLIGKISLIHSVDSLHLAEEINRQAEKHGFVQDVLIEVNASGEAQKSGLDFYSAKEEVIKIASLCPFIRVVGLMSMLPLSTDQDYLASLCKSMRTLFDDLKDSGLPFKHLSMGTSGDYQIAIANGSNMIRLGKTIFGERNYGEIK